jgi:hypothetical protein
MRLNKKILLTVEKSRKIVAIILIVANCNKKTPNNYKMFKRLKGKMNKMMTTKIKKLKMRMKKKKKFNRNCRLSMR